MTSFTITFEQPLLDVTAPIGRISYRNREVSPQPVDPQVEAARAIGALSRRLADLEQTVGEQLGRLGEQLQSLSIEVAQSVVSGHDELIQQRVTDYVQTALDQGESGGSPIVLVHPDCVETIRQWLTDHQEDGWTLEADASVAPGDCRIEWEQSGVAATLEAHLQAISQKLNELGGTAR